MNEDCFTAGKFRISFCEYACNSNPREFELDGVVVGSIGKGVLLLIGIERTDTPYVPHVEICIPE